MAPSIEYQEFGEGVDKIKFIKIDLKDPTPFSPDKFDELVNSSFKPEIGRGNYRYCKYNQYGDDVYIYEKGLSHYFVDKLLKENGIQGKLFEGGLVVITEEGIDSVRIMYGKKEKIPMLEDQLQDYFIIQ